MGKAELLALLEKQRDVLMERCAVKSLAIVGSAACAAMGGGSDVDLLVEFGAAPGFGRYCDLGCVPEDLIGRPSIL